MIGRVNVNVQNFAINSDALPASCDRGAHRVWGFGEAYGYRSPMRRGAKSALRESLCRLEFRSAAFQRDHPCRDKSKATDRTPNALNRRHARRQNHPAPYTPRKPKTAPFGRSRKSTGITPARFPQSFSLFLAHLPLISGTAGRFPRSLQGVLLWVKETILSRSTPTI